MKKYIKPSVLVQEMEMTNIICASLTEASDGTPQINTSGNISTGDAADAYSRPSSRGIWGDED